MLILGIDPGLTPTLLAYIAGLFDGEGYIGVKKRLPNWRNKLASPKYSVAVSIGMTDREPIELVARSFNAVNRVRVRQRKAHYKTIYELEFENARAVALLRAIRPYLIAKAKQAEIALALAELRANCRQHRTRTVSMGTFRVGHNAGRKYRITGLSEEYIARCDVLYQQALRVPAPRQGQGRYFAHSGN